MQQGWGRVREVVWRVKMSRVPQTVGYPWTGPCNPNPIGVIVALIEVHTLRVHYTHAAANLT